jgi:elongation factor Ts
MVAGAVATMGENIVPKRVARLEVSGAGLTGGYVHAGGKLGVIVGLRSGATGGAAENLAKDIAMHVAAHDPSPLAVDRDGVPSEAIENERELFKRQAEQEGKPEKVIEKIVEGRVKKYYSEVCLLEQGFVKDPDKKISDLLKEAAVALEASDLAITDFVRFRLGEAASS